jgi:preprotein translocase subunit SecA
MEFNKILRVGEGRQAKKVQAKVQLVNARSDWAAAMSDDELQAMTASFRDQLDNGAELDDIATDSFAVVREAAWRVLGQRPYDVQVFGGLTLHLGKIAEMKTGEGKTLTSTMPMYLNALPGHGVHLVTVNEYLARRDAEWMGQVHRWLGISVGAVYSQQTKESKRGAYLSDITYGTTNEFGFDYLRDNMVFSKDQQVQRGHNFALLDEVDSILVDEARTPLIISGPAEQSGQWYQVFATRVAPNLQRGVEERRPGGIIIQTGDYVVDEAKRNCGITDDGVSKVEKLLGVDNLYASVNTPLIQHLQNALKAKELFKRDREYIVSDGEVNIVDEQTGRVLAGRRYSEGLHQAIEAKERVKVKDENQTLATVTLQNYYRTYNKLAGMTGTAKTEESEFLEIYKLGVVEVPTNMPKARSDQGDLIYKTEKAKFAAAVDEIAERHEAGQPVLVGTTDVAKSELVSTMLQRRGIPHEVLNAKNHAREAHIVAQAGQKGAVTVSTNMAGRGTDIILGGNSEGLAEEEVKKVDLTHLPSEEAEVERQRIRTEALARFEGDFEQQHNDVVALGGLCVVGTERHESRRIDNQLRGRSGRQGDPGESRFYLSLEDDLMRLFNASAVDSIMTRLQIPEDQPIEAKMVSRAIASAQAQVESRNFDVRKNVLKYDDVLNEQRKVVYGQRQRIIDGDHEAIDELAQKYVEDAIANIVGTYAPPGVFPEEWDLELMETELKRIYECQYDLTSIDLEDSTAESLIAELIKDVDRAYLDREEEVGGDEVMREIERRVILSVVDRRWREHLYEMDALRSGIGLRAVGQRDPLVEYQREAYDSFVSMMATVKEEAVTYFFRLPVNQTQEQPADEAPQTGAAAPAVPAGAVAAAPSQDADADLPAVEPGATSSIDRSTEQDSEASDVGGELDVASRKAAAVVGAPTVPSEAKLSYSAPDEGGDSAISSAGSDEYEGTGRNDPCPCGSLEKFKRCHG